MSDDVGLLPGRGSSVYRRVVGFSVAFPSAITYIMSLAVVGAMGNRSNIIIIDSIYCTSTQVFCRPRIRKGLHSSTLYCSNLDIEAPNPLIIYSVLDAITQLCKNIPYNDV